MSNVSVMKRIDWHAWAPAIALVILLIVSASLNESFTNSRNITNVLRQVSYTGIIALGMTFVIVGAGIDLSVGSMTALIGGLTLMSMNQLSGGPDAPQEAREAIGTICMGAGAALLMGAIFGAINGLLITKGRITAFIATLGTMSIFRSMTTFVSDAQEITYDSDALYELGGGYLWGIPYPVWLFFFLSIIAHIILKKTPYGRHLCAVGSSEQVARFSAIKVQWVRFCSYVFAGVMVGFSALMLSSRLNAVSPGDMGHFYELDAIAAVVIGGTPLSGGRGSIFGTVVGAILLGVIDNMLNLMDVSSYLQGTVKGFVILVAVLVHFNKKDN